MSTRLERHIINDVKTYDCVPTTIRRIVHIASLLVLFNFNHVSEWIELCTSRVVGGITSFLSALNATALNAADLALKSHACWW